MPKRIDIAHLSFYPPFAPGSVNRIAGASVERIPEYNHVIISFWDGEPPQDGKDDQRLILVNWKGVPLWARLLARLPYRFRPRSLLGAREPCNVAYLWHVRRLIAELRPRLIICYDMPGVGGFLRRSVTWPCRLILSQHGLSYFLPHGEAVRTYSLESYDAVWHLTLASYRFDRARMSYYEAEAAVVPNPVDTERFRPPDPSEKIALRQRFGIPPDKLVVLFLAVLRRKKGAHVLLDCWERVAKAEPNALLWIVGAGEPWYEAYLRDMAERLGIIHAVRFEGRVPPELVPDCFKCADVFVFPTLVCEGFPLSLLEGMASGLACIVSDFVTAHEIVREDEVLFVPDPNLQGAFVEPILRVLRNPALRQELGMRARKAAEERFNMDVWANRLREFFEWQLRLVP